MPTVLHGRRARWSTYPQAAYPEASDGRSQSRRLTTVRQSVALPGTTRLFDNLREDFGRYYSAVQPLAPRLAMPWALLTYGFIAVCVYRYGRWTKQVRPRWLAWPLKVLYVLLYVPTELLFGIRISVNADIGPGLYIAHFGGIFVRCQAGRNLTVTQDVTIGSKGAGKAGGWPVLGDNIYIGSGAKIIGEIHIGDDVVIGANTTVTVDVPARMRVVGARIRISPLDSHAPAPDMHPRVVSAYRVPDEDVVA